VRTHYDNLKIAENAPDEVVRAAYRALSQRFHPDKNPGDANAERVMQIINDAYAVLSDPVRRRQYDESVARARAAEIAAQRSTAVPPPIHQPLPARPRRSFWQVVLLILFWDLRLTLFALIFGWVGIASLFEEKRPKQPYTPNPPPQRTNYAPAADRPTRPSYSRPATAPNGRPWPVRASYMPGYQLLAKGGLSSVTIDNSRNSSDVFLKLVSLDSAKAFPVRVCYIPAHAQFTFETVTAGRYDVRYRDLESGGYSKTEDFTLHETRTYQGTEFSNLSLTLYKVANGNMHTESITEADF
jgi:hypothetical protein